MSYFSALLLSWEEGLLRKLRFIYSKKSNTVFRMIFLNSVINSGAGNLLYLRPAIVFFFFTVGAVVEKGSLKEVKTSQYRQVESNTLWLKIRSK